MDIPRWFEDEDLQGAFVFVTLAIWSFREQQPAFSVADLDRLDQVGLLVTMVLPGLPKDQDFGFEWSQLRGSKNVLAAATALVRLGESITIEPKSMSAASAAA